MRSNARLRGAVAAALGAAAPSVPAFAGCGGGASEGANLMGANLRAATLVNATLTGANLVAAELFLAELPNRAKLTGVQWGATTCPSGRVSNTGC